MLTKQFFKIFLLWHPFSFSICAKKVIVSKCARRLFWVSWSAFNRNSNEFSILLQFNSRLLSLQHLNFICGKISRILMNYTNFGISTTWADFTFEVFRIFCFVSFNFCFLGRHRVYLLMSLKRRCNWSSSWRMPWTAAHDIPCNILVYITHFETSCYAFSNSGAIDFVWHR